MFRSILIGMLWLGSMSASAEALTVTEAWVAAAPPGQTVMAGYARFINQGDAPLKLTHTQSDQFERVEWHQSFVEAGMARMRKVTDVGLDVGQQMALEPGGMHLMLIKPHVAIKPGDQILIQFQSDASETYTASFEVRRVGEGSAGSSTHDHYHQHLNH